MMQTIRSYMDEEITSDQFEEALAEVSRATSDEGVAALREELWYIYDDLTDHPIVAYKHDWDYLNRLLLLLASNAEIAVERRWCTRYVLTQTMAGVAFATYSFLAIRSGFSGEVLVTLALPFGLIAKTVAWLRTCQGRTQVAVEPFPSVRSLFAVRRSVSSFIRKRYPQRLKARKVRGPVLRTLLWLYEVALVALLSPIVLLIQALPNRERRFTISGILISS
ncbi:MAG: hypothetical protein ABI759_08870 [Candidatus Solibacter sp.]